MTETNDAGPQPTSTFIQYLGISIDHREAGAARLRLKLLDMHMRGDGTAHGGLLTAMADTSLSQALRSIQTPDEVASTIELKVNYLSPARLGETMVSEAKVVQREGHIAIVAGDIREESSGRLVLTGLGTFIVEGRRPPKT